MQADFITKFRFTGTKEERKKFADILRLYDRGRSERPADFNFLDSEIDACETSEKDEVQIEATGPWGYYSDLNDVDIFREIAEATPDAKFDAFIDGSDSYSDQQLKVRLKDRKLYTVSYLYSYEEEDDGFIDYLMSKLPYKKFVEMFKINKDEFQEGDYAEYIQSFAFDDFEGLDAVSYDDFCENVQGSEITEEEYAKACEEIKKMGIHTYYEYKEMNDGGYVERFIYDPVEKKYIKGNPMPGGPVDVTDVLKEQAEKSGLEKDFSELTVEEAYGLLGDVLDNKPDDDETVEFFKKIFDDDFFESDGMY